MDRKCTNATCPVSYFEQIYSNGIECLKCHKTCLSCSGPTHTDCTQCAAGRIMTKDHSCVACPLGQFVFKSDPFECRDCDNSCSRCTGPGRDDCLGQVDDDDEVVEDEISNYSSNSEYIPGTRIRWTRTAVLTAFLLFSFMLCVLMAYRMKHRFTPESKTIVSLPEFSIASWKARPVYAPFITDDPSILSNPDIVTFDARKIKAKVKTEKSPLINERIQ